jgi:predicted transcriptional regulator
MAISMVARRAVFDIIEWKFWIQYLFWELAIILTVSLHSEKYTLLEHKLSTFSNKILKTISMVARTAIFDIIKWKFWARYSFWKLAIILTVSLHSEKYTLLEH